MTGSIAMHNLGGLAAEHKLARRVWTGVERAFPRSSGLPYRIGAAYVLEGDYGRAVPYLVRANKLGAGNVDVVRLLGLAAFSSGADDLALRSSIEGLLIHRIEPDFEVMQAALAFESNDYARSIRIAKQLVVKGPAYGEAWRWIGSSAIELGDCSIVRQLRLSMPQESGAALLAEARCQRARGDLTTARELYVRAARRSDTSLAAREHLAVLVGRASKDLPQIGALVVEVLPQGEGSKSGLRTGDILVGVESFEVRCSADVSRSLSRLQQQRFILWRVARRGQQISLRTRAGPLGIGTVDF